MFFLSVASMTVRHNQVLILSDINGVRMAIGVPQNMVFKRGDELAAETPHAYLALAESQKHAPFVQKDEGGWGEEVGAGDGNDFG